MREIDHFNLGMSCDPSRKLATQSICGKSVRARKSSLDIAMIDEWT